MTIDELSTQLNEAMEPSPSEIVEMAHRYDALRKAIYVTADGDKLTAHEYEKERSYLRMMLQKAIEKDGALYVEGVGTLKLQERRETVYDLPSIIEHDPKTFARMAELGCLKVDGKVMKAQVAAGNVFEPKQKIEQVSARALVVEEA